MHKENPPLNPLQGDGPFKVDQLLVLSIAVPMTLAYLTTPLLGLVDTAVVGRFGDPALIGGLAIGAIIIDLIFTTFNFLRAGTTGLTAQALGANDEKEKQAILFRALMIGLSSGLIMILASPLILVVGLWFMAAEDSVSQAAGTYFLIRTLSAPFALSNYVLLGWLLGLGKSGTTLAIQMLLNGINILMSIALGIGLGWGIVGVAIGTIIGEFVAFIVGLSICWKMLTHTVRPSKERLFNRPAWIRLINVNGDIMIRSFALFFAFAFFTSQGAQYDSVTLASNAILLHFFLIAGFFLDGLATAAEQIIGRSVGAKYAVGFWKGFKLTLIWSMVLAVLCSLIFFVGGPTIISIMTTNTDVQTTARTYLAWAALTPVTGMLAFNLDGVFIGATWTRDMTVMMLVSLAVYLVFWWAVKEPFGNHGLWAALHVFLITRGITLAFRLKPRANGTFA